MTQQIAGHLVRCRQCGVQTVALDGRNVHDALNCACCPGDHTHDDGTGRTVNPCRNVDITAHAVPVEMVA